MRADRHSPQHLRRADDLSGPSREWLRLGLRLRSVTGTIAPLGHELVELGPVLRKAQALQKLLKLALFFLKSAQRVGAIFVESAIAARGRMRPPPVDPTAHAVHLVLPPAHAVMVPATHSSSPYHESQDGEAQRPPPDETENHQRDPGRLSKLVDPCCDRHSGASLMNVNNIYIAPSDCQEGGIRVGQLLHGLAHRRSLDGASTFGRR